MPTSVVVDYIDSHRDKLGVEPICKTLAEAGVKIAPSTYYAAKTRSPSARAVRDAQLVQEIRGAHAVNLGVYGPARSTPNSTGKGPGSHAAPWNG